MSRRLTWSTTDTILEGVTDVTIGIGETLREARESQERTAQAVALSLKVRTDHVTALEEEDWEVFGADAYARGHLRNYARELGLDPAPLMAEYDRHVSREDRTAHMIADGPVATQPREPLPAWVSIGGVAALVIVALVVIGQVFGGRTPAPADPVDDVVATGTETSSEPTPEPTTATPTPEPTPTFDGVQLLLAFEDDSWVRITVDGETVREGVVNQGEVQEFQGSQSVTVRYGNAGGVRVQLNGSDLGFPGSSGEVTEVTYTPEGPGADGTAEA